jgi:hypothetical protein
VTGGAKQWHHVLGVQGRPGHRRRLGPGGAAGSRVGVAESAGSPQDRPQGALDAAVEPGHRPGGEPPPEGRNRARGKPELREIPPRYLRPWSMRPEMVGSVRYARFLVLGTPREHRRHGNVQLSRRVLVPSKKVAYPLLNSAPTRQSLLAQEGTRAGRALKKRRKELTRVS